MAHTEKILAIFENHQALNNALDVLNAYGFNREEISVLIKRLPDDTSDVEPAEVRTYSPTTYPPTAERTKILSQKDYGAYATETHERPLVHPLVHPLGYSSTVPSETIFDPVTETAGITDHGGTAQPEPDTHVVDSQRLDQPMAKDHDVSLKDPTALRKDSMTGGALGLLAGAALLLIPGVGPVLAAGPIAAGIAALAAGAALGTTAGVLVGLFQDEGIPRDLIDTYRQAFDTGKGIVILKPSNESDCSLARTILNRHHPKQIDQVG